MQDMDKIIDELTLMLLYLTSWQECPTEEIGINRSERPRSSA